MDIQFVNYTTDPIRLRTHGTYLSARTPLGDGQQLMNWLKPASTSNMEVFDPNMFIMEDRVGADYKACKQGKSRGPERLGNDMYLNYAN